MIKRLSVGPLCSDDLFWCLLHFLNTQTFVKINKKNAVTFLEAEEIVALKDWLVWTFAKVIFKKIKGKKKKTG